MCLELEQPCFAYLNDNHTSVVGAREIVSIFGVSSVCLAENHLIELFKKGTATRKHCESYRGRALFVYPAESNFCGRKYPLQWIKNIQEGCLGLFELINYGSIDLRR